MQEWFPKHGSDQVRKPIDTVIAALKADGVTRFGATGYCFGGTLSPPVSQKDIEKQFYYPL
jgi:dienelactone hydrolase